VFSSVGDAGIQPWNPHGWFDLAPDPSAPDNIIDSYQLITYRIGQDRPAKPLFDEDASKWRAPADVLGKQILLVRQINDLSTWIWPTGYCDLHGTVFPDYAQSFGSVVDQQFVTHAGHRNALGIFNHDSGNDGAAFLRALMKRGMLLDVDHMSQQMRVDAYHLASSYAQEAGRPLCSDDSKPCGDYPVMGVHTNIRQVEREGSGDERVRYDFGSTDESTRTVKELSYVAKRGGTIGVFPRSTFIPPNTKLGQCRTNGQCLSGVCDTSTHMCEFPTDPALKVGTPARDRFNRLWNRNFDVPTDVANDCDGSSKSFAIKYLFMADVMKGHGLTLTTDFNGLNGLNYPRFGRGNPGSPACGQSGRAQAVFGDMDHETSPGAPTVASSPWSPTAMMVKQQVETSGIWYDDYLSKTPTESFYSVYSNWTDPKRPINNKRWKQVVARGPQLREDGAPRYPAYKDGSPIADTVFYNDYGPDLAPHHWYEQNGNRVGAQLRPMKRWRRFRSGWDYNLDGFQHIGLLPDLLQDMRNVGVQWEQLGPMFDGANDLISTWQKSVDIGGDHP
jgi:hypothetical protein